MTLYMQGDHDGGASFAKSAASAERCAAKIYGYDTAKEARKDGWLKGKPVKITIPLAAAKILLADTYSFM